MRELVPLAILALVSACGSSGSDSPAPACGVARTGVVQVNVDSLPDGADASAARPNPARALADARVRVITLR